MKTKMMLMLAMAGVCFTLKAQDKTQGKVSYEVSINLHASLKPDQLQFKDLIPEFSSTEEVLYFNGNRAKIERVKPGEQRSEEGVSIKMSFEDGKKGMYSDGTAEGTYYLIEKDGKNSLKAISTDLKTDLKKENNKQNKDGKTKAILGFTCRGVVSGETTFWISTELPFKIGPFGLFSKEGAILGVEMKGNKAYATSIEYIPVKAEEVTAPAGLPIEKK